MSDKSQTAEIDPVIEGPEGPPSSQQISELALAEGASRVTVPWGSNEYICPACEQPIPNRRIVYLGKPAKYQHLLNDIIKCPRPACRFIFSPRSDVVALRA